MTAEGRSLSRWIAELRRRKVVRVAIAYLVAAWLLIQVAAETFEPLGLPSEALRFVIVLAALGFPLACVLAWAFDLTPRGIERTPPAEPAVAANAAVLPPAVPSVPAPTRPAAGRGKPLAILPFADLSPARDQEYFCDGIAEEIITLLCCVGGLRVASRTSSFQFRGRTADVREVGRALGVDAVLEGSVRKAGERVRITAQLVDCADGYHLWSESFDRRLDDVFAIQTEIAQKLVKSLRLTLSPQETALLDRGGTRNAQAYDLYLRGQALMRDGTDATLPRAVELYREAIRHDPQFAQAHAGLANALAVTTQWRLGMSDEDFREAFRASARAIELQPHMPEAHVASASLLSSQGRNADAEREFEAALSLNPASFDALYLYGRHCFALGDAERALRLYESAHRARPDEYLPLSMWQGALARLGWREEEREIGRRALDAIEARLALEPGDARALMLGAVAAARLGQADRARSLAERTLQATPNSFAALYNVACTHAVLDERDEALRYLDEAVRHGRGNLAWIEHDPDFDALRDDPRFVAIVGRLRSPHAPAQNGPAP